MKRFLRIALVGAALFAGLESVRAQDHRDYYWVQDSGNWYDLAKWQVLQEDGTFATATELPDATNRVFINGAGAASPVAITGSLLPITVDINMSPPVFVDPAAGPVAVRSIRFGGTIPAGTLVNFTTGLPLSIAESLVADYPLAIRVGSTLVVNGGVTLNAAGSDLVLNAPATVTGAVAVNAAATITVNGTLQTGAVAINAPASVAVGAAGSLQTGALAFGAGATNASLLANGPVSVTGTINVNAPTTLTANHNFSAGSITFTNTAGISRLTLGNPATASTTANLGTVTVNSPAILTANNATNTTLSMASVTFAVPAPLPAAVPQLLINRPTTVAGAVTVNSPAVITTTSAFTAGSMAFASTAGASSLSVSGQPTTINGPLSVSSNTTITTGSLLDVRGAMTVNANAPITINGTGELRASTLTYGTAATGATLTANGPVTVNGAMNVEAVTGITFNRSFLAGTLTYSSTAGTSTLIFGNPAQANTSATISGAVAFNSAAVITANNATNTILSMGSLTFGGNASLTLNRPTVIAGAVAYNANATMTANNSLSIGGNLTFATGVTTGAISVNGPVSLRGSLFLAGPNNLAGNAATGSLAFTSTAANTVIQSSGAVYPVPVLFNGLSGNTRGRWILQDNMTIRVRAQFVNGHVVALPAAATNPFNPNALVPPTEPFDATKAHTTVVSPMMIFETNDGVTPSIYATASGASNVSHVIGYVRKMQVQKTTFEVPGRETSFAFPIGDGTYYRPLTMFDPSSAVANWTARYLSVDPVANSGISASRHKYELPLQGRVSDKEFWYLTASASANTRMMLSYLHPNPAIVQSNYYRVDKWPGLTIAGMSINNNNATWKDIDGRPTYPGPGGGTISTAGAMGSSAWFTIARRDQSPLPVRLVSFSAQYVDGQVQLKWQSAEEKNTSHFEIERSADGKNFSQVLTKKAQGNSSSLVSYNATDNSPHSGTSYYRLRMVDLDGTFEYSKMVSVSAESDMLVRAYPNPSRGYGIHFEAGNGSKLVLKSVSNLFGKPVGYQAATSAEGLQVSFAQPLPAGFYVATLADDDNGQLVKVKFVVQ